jgi:hypothetical protein
VHPQVKIMQRLSSIRAAVVVGSVLSKRSKLKAAFTIGMVIIGLEKT